MLWHKTIGAGGISKGLEFVNKLGGGTGDDTNITIDISSFSLEADDLLVLAVGFKDNTDRDVSATNFTELVDAYANSSSDANLFVGYKVSDGTETSIAVNTNTTSFTAFNVYQWRGVDTLSPIDTTVASAQATNGTIASSPDVTTVTDNAVIMQFADASGGGSQTILTTLTEPSGTENSDKRGGNANRLTTCSSIQETAGTTSLNDFSGGVTGDTGQSFVTATIAIRPNQQSNTWTPADITTELWYDAADLSTVTLGSTSGVQNVSVSRWNDKSGNGNDVTDSGGSSKDYTYGQFNGHNCIEFSDGWLRERVSTLGISTNFSILAVGSVKTTNIGQFDRLFSLKTSDDNQDWDNNFSFNMYWDSGVAIDIGNSDATEQTVANNEAFMLEAYCSSGSLDQYFNGSLIDSAINTSVNLSVEDIGIGVAFGFTSDQIWNGDICEIVVIPTSSSSDRQKAEGYLAHKWGTEDDLPSDHPYKYSPPTS